MRAQATRLARGRRPLQCRSASNALPQEVRTLTHGQREQSTNLLDFKPFGFTRKLLECPYARLTDWLVYAREPGQVYDAVFSFGFHGVFSQVWK